VYKAGAAVGRWPLLLSKEDKPLSPRDFTNRSLEGETSHANFVTHGAQLFQTGFSNSYILTPIVSRTYSVLIFDSNKT